MYKFKTIVLLGLSFIVFIPAFLHAQLSVEGEYRPRSEYRNGYRLLNTPETEPAYFISQRMRLSAMYESEKYKIKVAGQDVRVWGEVDQLQDNPSVNIHEAWASVYLGQHLQLKMGRQELVYDNQRLLGSVNWTQQGRSHDALVAQWQMPSRNLRIDVGGSYNQESAGIYGNSYTLNNYKMLSYLWMNKRIANIDASVLFVMDGFESQPDVMNYRYTYGTHLSYRSKPWQLSASVYGQQGADAVRSDISAYMVSINGSYNIDQWQFTAGYDYLSGGSTADENPAEHTFSTLYATNHKFYGHMDYFLNIPSDTRGGGLQDLYMGIDYEFSEEANVSIRYHRFALANRIPDPQNSSQVVGKRLGSEVDISMGYQFTSEISFHIGYSTLIETSSLEQLQLRDPTGVQHWGWAMLQLTPQIVES